MSSIDKINVGGVDFDIDVKVNATDVSFDPTDTDLEATNTEDAIKEVASATKQLNQNLIAIRSHIGMIIHSTTLDTEEKVKAIYGGTSWSKIEGRFLLGASSSYPVKSMGGSDSEHISSTSSEAGGYGFVASSAFTNRGLIGATDGRSISHMPPYKAVYIWERIA